MTSNELRAKFLAFFASKGHEVVRSSPLVPGDDPTLLFTNAGMVQFKDVFTGQDKRAYVRAASSQKCVRAGGKHNDLDNVGYTARHHTFFEMLGNFSFGDYFKEDAIAWAWEFITSPAWLGIDKNRLLVTVYHTDDEAAAIWQQRCGVPPERIVRIGDNKGAKYASDNFWAMGDTGPCGPCTEIFYDHDPDGSKGIYGGPPGSPEEDGDRWIEIWNVVFMQFERLKDGSLTPLPKPSVDTGMGLERISALMQGSNDNYQTDTFRHLIGQVATLAGQAPYQSPSQKVIADHIRATAFLMADGVMPSNEGRGYVLRRIMRRAIRHGYKLGINRSFFFKLVAPLADLMGEAYPELRARKSEIEAAIVAEEQAFALTLDRGMKLLEDAFAQSTGGVLAGDVAFKLYDTYGFPLDLTADVCRERGLTVDEAGYQAAMAEQQARSKGASKFKGGDAVKYEGPATCFVGYTDLHVANATVVALFSEQGQPVQRLAAGESGQVVLDTTPFYAESGGQVGDKGSLRSAATAAEFAVSDTQKIAGGVFAHIGTVNAGSLTLGDTLTATVGDSQRRASMRNHSATHLLHKALRDVLGSHVAQKGSLVNEQRTRFDFSHAQAMTADEVAEVERRVNAAVLANVPVEAEVMGFDAAIAKGAMALFGEKYGDEVRVLRMGEHSTELCGGTHVARTGDIGLFKLVSEAGVSAGVRRVEAVTGDNALAYVAELETRIRTGAGLLKANPQELVAKIEAALDRSKALEKELATVKARLAAAEAAELAEQAVVIGSAKLVAAQIDGLDGNALRGMLDVLRGKLGAESMVMLGSAVDGKVALIAGVSPALTSKVKAGELVNFVAGQVGGKGGGKPDMAQAGGTDPGKLPDAMASVAAWVAAKL